MDNLLYLTDKIHSALEQIMVQELIQDLLKQAGITINGNKPWDIMVYNDQFYSRLLTNVELAIGESYMDNWWDCKNLDQFFYHVFNANLEHKVLANSGFWQNKLSHTFFAWLHNFINYQTKKKSIEVGNRHYDIGNDLFKIMLDKRMIYTCAYWEGATTLDEAQEKKLKLVCEKLQLKAKMKILDIGCGWGGFAKYAAEHYDVTVTGLTISKQQFDLGCEICRDLPVEIRLEDYRDLLKDNIQYDRVVSLGMFEHVGYKNYSTYMKIIADCLKDDGLFLLHTIGSNLSNSITDKWIETYIFPNGQLPSIAQIGTAIEGIFIMEDWQNFGIYYDKTLMAWHQNFMTHWEEIKNNYDERFRRMWEYYLLSSAAAFRSRKNQLWQIVLSKNGLPNGYLHPVLT